MDEVTAQEPVAQTLEKYQHIFNPWPAFVEFLQQLKDTSLILYHEVLVMFTTFGNLLCIHIFTGW